jgi:hypothetical protein
LARADFEAQFDATSALASGYNLVVTQLKMGDMKAYQGTCDKLHSLFVKNSSTTSDVNAITWLCVLAPKSVQNYKPLIETFKLKVEKAVQDQTENSYIYLNTLSALQFRAGHWGEAENLLHQSRKERQRDREKLLARDLTLDSRQSNSPVFANTDGVANTDDAGTLWDWLFLAMTYKELNDMASAERWLKLAQDRFESEAGESWTRRAELEILLAEATLRIKGQSPP